MKEINEKRVPLKSTSIIFLVVIILYPILFSFSHALTHHLETHFHGFHQCDHSSSFNPSVNYNLVEVDKPTTDKCPICAYEFAQAIYTEILPLKSVNHQFAIVNFPLSESTLSPDICRINAPRAPPIS